MHPCALRSRSASCRLITRVTIAPIPAAGRSPRRSVPRPRTVRRARGSASPDDVGWSTRRLVRELGEHEGDVGRLVPVRTVRRISSIARRRLDDGLAEVGCSVSVAGRRRAGRRRSPADPPAAAMESRTPASPRGREPRAKGSAAMTQRRGWGRGSSAASRVHFCMHPNRHQPQAEHGLFDETSAAKRSSASPPRPSAAPVRGRPRLSLPAPFGSTRRARGAPARRHDWQITERQAARPR